MSKVRNKIHLKRYRYYQTLGNVWPCAFNFVTQLLKDWNMLIGMSINLCTGLSQVHGRVQKCANSQLYTKHTVWTRGHNVNSCLYLQGCEVSLVLVSQ